MVSEARGITLTEALCNVIMESILKYGYGEFDDEERDYLIAPFGYKIAPDDGQESHV